MIRDAPAGGQKGGSILSCLLAGNPHAGESGSKRA